MQDYGMQSAPPRRSPALWIVALAPIALLVIGGIVCVSIRFSLIGKEEACATQWANVQSVYQRRLDLVPNLVEVVKGAAKHERETLTQVTEARNKMLGIHQALKDAVQKGDPKEIERLYPQLLQSEKSFISVSTEAYPNLKANEGFLNLQSQLEGTENRINVERIKYNEAVGAYNTAARKYSSLPLCGGFQPKVRFEAEPGAEKAPKVKFD